MCVQDSESQGEDIKDVTGSSKKTAPFVGLNSRYTYFLLAKDFSDTCLVALHSEKIVGFSSGYVPPARKDTFFNWEIVVASEYRGNGLQKLMLLQQIQMADAQFLEATVNPSNEASKQGFHKLAQLLGAELEEKLLFSEEDFENEGHTKPKCSIR
jgi:L-2,4-diaminobutyric acid acetyltransferase